MRATLSRSTPPPDNPDAVFFEPARILKILSSPKPPSPAFYFKLKGENGGQYGHLEMQGGHQKAIAKYELTFGKHVPNGRKFYHEHGKLPDEQHGRRLGATWHCIDKNSNQKIRITPIKPETTFLFHIDFDNLNCWELGLLSFALRPAFDYRHRIGIGKSLGLGRVLIEPLALFEIDRFDRYTRPDALTAPRYSVERTHVLVPPNRIEPTYPRRFGGQDQVYRRECEMITAAAVAGSQTGIEALIEAFEQDADDNTLEAIRKFGENPPQRGSYCVPVRQPQLAGYEEFDEETETFRWYVDNDRYWHRAMPLLVEDRNGSGRVHNLEELVLPRHQRFRR